MYDVLCSALLQQLQNDEEANLRLVEVGQIACSGHNALLVPLQME